MRKIKAQVKLITAPSSFAYDGERKYRQLMTMSSAVWQRKFPPTIGWIMIGMKQRNQRTLGVVLIYLEQIWTTCLECLLCLSVSKTHISHLPGRPLRIDLMSRYICFSQNGRFDVSFEELFSKAKNSGGFFRKLVF